MTGGNEGEKIAPEWSKFSMPNFPQTCLSNMTCFYLFFGIRCKARASGNEPRLSRMWENSGGICTHDSSQHGAPELDVLQTTSPRERIPPRNSHLSSHQQFGLQRQPSHLPQLWLWLWADSWHGDMFSNVCANMKSVRSITVMWPRWRGLRYRKMVAKPTWSERDWNQHGVYLKNKFPFLICRVFFLYERAKFYTSKV